MLPLDLHVLGLPLAFILSQDQTLHRRLVYIYAPAPEARSRALDLNYHYLLMLSFPRR